MDVGRYTTGGVARQAAPEGTHRSPAPSIGYELYGVVCHRGNLSGGHYVSFVRTGGRWYRCDDAWIVEVTEAEVLASQAYLLYYQHQDTCPVGGGEDDGED